MKQQKEFVAQTQQELQPVFLRTLTKRVKTYLPYFLIAVTLVTAFFAHESLVTENIERKNLETQWIEAKSKRTIALNAVKQLAVDTPEYNAYLVEKENTKQLFIKLNASVEKEQFNGFPNFQYFIGEFGWAFGLFIIGLYMMFRDLIRKSPTLKAEMIINGTVLTISLFFITYALWPINYLPKGDFSKTTYIFFNIITATFICFGANLLIKHKTLIKQKLTAHIRRLFDFIIIDAPNYVEEIKQKDYDNKIDDLVNEFGEQY